MNKVWEGIKTRWNAIPSDIRGIFVNAYDKIKGIFEDLPGFFGDIWDKVKSKAKSFGIAIGGAISGAVKGVINGVISTIEKSINGAISLINGALGIINKIPKVDIPLLKKLNLPKLARGGIVSSPTIAEVGEAGREAIVPLENNKGWIKELANELNKSMLTPLNTTRTRTAEQQKLNDYNNLVSAFKTALTQVKVELDDDEVGSFVTKTVSNAIYS
jgi:phage-related protein